jgi:arsenate reductase
MTDRPTVLYACVHKSGRSVAAKCSPSTTPATASRCARPAPSPARGSTRWCAGARRAGPVHGRGDPKKLDDAAVRAADVVVTMGCGETCPYFPGKRYGTG